MNAPISAKEPIINLGSIPDLGLDVKNHGECKDVIQAAIFALEGIKDPITMEKIDPSRIKVSCQKFTLALRSLFSVIIQESCNEEERTRGNFHNMVYVENGVKAVLPLYLRWIYYNVKKFEQEDSWEKGLWDVEESSHIHAITASCYNQLNAVYPKEVTQHESWHGVALGLAFNEFYDSVYKAGNKPRPFHEEVMLMSDRAVNKENNGHFYYLLRPSSRQICDEKKKVYLTMTYNNSSSNEGGHKRILAERVQGQDSWVYALVDLDGLKDRYAQNLTLDELIQESLKRSCKPGQDSRRIVISAVTAPKTARARFAQYKS